MVDVNVDPEEIVDPYKNKQIYLEVEKWRKEEWDEFAEKDPESNNRSHMIRLAVSYYRNRDEGREIEIGLEDDIREIETTIENEVADIESEIRSLRNLVEERPETEQAKIKIYDRLSELDPDTYQRAKNVEDPEIILHHARENIKSSLDIPEARFEKAIRQLYYQNPRVQRAPFDHGKFDKTYTLYYIEDEV